MTDLEARLENALRADAPAQRDPMFRIEVLLRRERAALRRRLLVAVAAAFAAAVLFALVLAVIDQTAAGPVRLAAVAAAGAVLAVSLAASCVGAATLQGLAGRWRARMLWTSRALPRLSFWP